jgi:hypothetical protein
MPLCDLRTKKDVVENALMLLGWAAAESSKGLTIAAVNEARHLFKEVHTPALEGARSARSRGVGSDDKATDDAAESYGAEEATVAAVS